MGTAHCRRRGQYKRINGPARVSAASCVFPSLCELFFEGSRFPIQLSGVSRSAKKSTKIITILVVLLPQSVLAG